VTNETATRRGLVYTVPLRDFEAQLVLPSDLSAGEAFRLGSFLLTLVNPREVQGFNVHACPECHAIGTHEHHCHLAPESAS